MNSRIAPARVLTPNDAEFWNWRDRNPGYVEASPEVLANGWVEIDGGKFAELCRIGSLLNPKGVAP